MNGWVSVWSRYVCKWSFIETQPHTFIYVCGSPEVECPAKPEVFVIWYFTEQVCWTLECKDTFFLEVVIIEATSSAGEEALSLLVAWKNGQEWSVQEIARMLFEPKKCSYGEKEAVLADDCYPCRSGWKAGFGAWVDLGLIASSAAY